uniref:Potassium transporter n=1 Tax=Tanacetum cinerariifolium TaxID=118510 RepID=A0A6L2LX19_TANCI|nr:potassium transporter [Tanacetum cinerariifolium]
MRLAFQSLGVVYGDLGTSPLYVFYNTFPKGVDDTEDIVGALSLIIYSLTLVPLIKYVFIVCRASDNGQGGTFALYSLLCRHAKIKTIPNQHRTDERLTTYSRTPIHENSFAAKTKGWLEAHALKKNALLVLVLVGTCMVIGDGILTPAISVLSASGGLKVNHPGMRNELVVVLAVFILVGGVGIFNILEHDTAVLRAFSPLHILWYFRRRGKDGWTSLGGIMLSITGTEALFADLAHFPLSAIQLAFTSVVFPCLLLAYCGQAAYLMKNKEQVYDAFYHSIPERVYWPMFIVATLAAIVANICSRYQLGSYDSLYSCNNWISEPKPNRQCLRHGSRDSDVGDNFPHVVIKVDQGAWVPLAIAAVFLLIMYVWHYGTVKRYEFEMQSKISMAWILNLGPSLGLVRVPGIGLVYTELASGVPRIFSHFITNLPAIHSVVVFVCVKSLPVYTVPEEERFLVRRIGPKNYHMFRCVARYGYKDRKRDDDFEKKILDSIFLFVKLESLMEGSSDSDDYSLYDDDQETIHSNDLNDDDNNTFSSIVDITVLSNQSVSNIGTPSRYHMEDIGDEMEFVTRCRNAGVVHLFGNTIIKARSGSGIYNKICINYMYAFLRKICRQHSVIFNVPHESLLNVGQCTYRVVCTHEEDWKGIATSNLELISSFNSTMGYLDQQHKFSYSSSLEWYVVHMEVGK